MTAVLKTVGGNARGFESYTLRHVSDGLAILTPPFNGAGRLYIAPDKPVRMGLPAAMSFPPGLDMGARLSWANGVNRSMIKGGPSLRALSVSASTSCRVAPG